jgi:hypothetical protein
MRSGSPGGGDLDDLADVAVVKPSQLQLARDLKVARRRFRTLGDVCGNFWSSKGTPSRRLPEGAQT